MIISENKQVHTGSVVAGFKPSYDRR